MNNIVSTLWNELPGMQGFYNFGVFFLVFSPLELLIPAQRGQKLFRQGWVTDLLHFLFTAILTASGIGAMIGGALLLSHLIIPDAVKTWVSSSPLWLQVVVGTVLADLFFYFGHRIQHEVPWLWDFHAVHHSSTELDWLAAFRVHPIDQMIERGTALIPIALLGFSLPAVMIIGLLYQWQALLIHSNVGLRTGWLKWLVATPEFHHWHHSREAAGYNKNFSGQLPLWDIVFGTAYLPSTMPTSYGINEPMSGSYVMQLLHPFRRLALRLRHHWAARAEPPPAKTTPTVAPAEGLPLVPRKIR